MTAGRQQTHRRCRPACSSDTASGRHTSGWPPSGHSIPLALERERIVRVRSGLASGLSPSDSDLGRRRWIHPYALWHCFDVRTAMAEVVFASQVLFFFGADPDWCKSYVLPLLDWADPPRAHRAWGGFLIWGRWSDRLLAAGLLDHYLEAVRYIEGFPDEPRRQLAGHLASVALTSEIDPLPWVRKFMVRAQLRDRTEWIHQVHWLLSRLPVEAVEHQWNRWMLPYWKERLASIPRQMTVEESSAMVGWVVHLTDSVEDGVALAISYPAAIENHGDLLHQLHTGRLDQAPASFARLIAHLLRGTSPPFWGGHYLAELVPRLRAGQADPADIRGIVEEAMRLGNTDAPNW
jgi:hypothetical protein